MSNNSLVLGHFLPSSLLQQSTPIRRLTSTSSDSEDSGVDSSYRQERKIFVGGVPSSVGPEELAQFFQSYGQVEEAFIIYDRYSGRHRGFGFVTFADMSTTKTVCSTRIFHLHGRKIECKRALKREEIVGGNDGDFHEYKSFRPNDFCPTPPESCSSTSIPPSVQFGPTSVPLSYGQYRQSSPTVVNPLGAWLVDPSMQTLPHIFHPMLNPHQQYAVFPLSSLMWNHPYQQAPLQSPFLPELVLPPTSSPTLMMNLS